MRDAIIEDVTSRDPARVYAAAWAIHGLRDPARLDTLAAALAEIERAAEGVDLGGALVPNRETLAFALEKLRYHRDGAGCLCGLYPRHLGYDPEQEEAAGHVRILERRFAGRWPDGFRCECTGCGARFDVTSGEQHTSWWAWSPA